MDRRDASFLSVLLFALVGLPAVMAQQLSATSPAGDRRGGANELHARLTSSPQRWAPADVDETVPPIAPGVRCLLPEVLQSAGERINELVTNLRQFTATEHVEHQKAGKAGNWHAPRTVSFNYLAELQEPLPGMLRMEEMRDGSASPAVFPDKLADLGLPAMVVVFHPYFVDQFSMSCEGLGDWRGQPAWQIHFKQRPDRPVRVRGWVVRGREFPIKLKGRAWVAADSFQVLHLEADLLEPVPEIRLVREHMTIDYQPVRFQQRDVELWLPQSAEVYMDFQEQYYRRRHSFSDFLLFSVDVSQKVVVPKEP